jgi:serine/threonine protein kinase
MTEQAQLYTGRTLGPYELLVPLAQGATAQVWAARATGSRLEKIVAIKTMLTEFSADVDAESMFLDEARLVSRIRHPNVAAVLDLGEADDALYIVIEWVEGEPLQVVLREAKARGVPLPLALRIVKLAASGLHAAHDLCDEGGKPVGLVHRDVSPQNILVGYDGSVKVIDFGVAKATSNMQRTSVGQIKGKVPYMAPEQAMGEPVDRRTDVFALGVVLYQLVAGKHPFRADSEFATLARVRDRNPAESPRAYVPDLPPALEEAMLKALAKKRDDRFATMLEFGRALERAVPSPPDVDRALGTFMAALLSERAAKRQHAIREALRAVSERTGNHARPVNLGNKPIFDDAGDELAKQSSGIHRLDALVAPEAPPIAPAVAPPATAPRPAVVSADLDLPVIPGLHPTRQRTRLIGAGIAVFLILLLALWALAGDSSDGGDSSGPAPTKRAF